MTDICSSSYNILKGAVNMNNKLVIDENSVYEIDLDCVNSKNPQCEKKVELSVQQSEGECKRDYSKCKKCNKIQDF